MTYNVLMGTLKLYSLTHSLTHSLIPISEHYWDNLQLRKEYIGMRSEHM